MRALGTQHGLNEKQIGADADRPTGRNKWRGGARYGGERRGLTACEFQDGTRGARRYCIAAL